MTPSPSSVSISTRPIVYSATVATWGAGFLRRRTSSSLPPSCSHTDQKWRWLWPLPDSASLDMTTGKVLVRAWDNEWHLVDSAHCHDTLLVPKFWYGLERWSIRPICWNQPMAVAEFIKNNLNSLVGSFRTPCLRICTLFKCGIARSFLPCHTICS